MAFIQNVDVVDIFFSQHLVVYKKRIDYGRFFGKRI